jgi:hypothetical protein
MDEQHEASDGPNLDALHKLIQEHSNVLQQYKPTERKSLRNTYPGFVYIRSINSELTRDERIQIIHRATRLPDSPDARSFHARHHITFWTELVAILKPQMTSKTEGNASMKLVEQVATLDQVHADMYGKP